MKLSFLLIWVLLTADVLGYGGNKTFQDFNTATKKLLNKVYQSSKVQKKTIYCKADFEDRKIINANGFKTDKFLNRQKKMEWEHIVPAKEFGKNFHEWTKKNQICEEKGINGRSCAKMLSQPFRFMYCDLYNIYPSIGALNAMRQDYEFIEGNADISKWSTVKSYVLSEELSTQFGQCPVIIKDKKVLLSNYSKGIVARAYLYMDSTYEKYRLKYKKKILFKAWSKEYPVTPNECSRTKLIEKLQRNENKVVKKLCKKSKMW